MPTRRMIDPAFWKSERFEDTTIAQRLLFIGLISTADDQGRMKAHPALIRAKVFPYDDIPLPDIERDLQCLNEIGAIQLYSNDEHCYLQIVKWWKHQHPQWAYPSKYPAPEGWTEHLRYRKDDQVHTENWPVEPLPKALPKDLPKALGDTLSQDATQPHSTSTSISTSKDPKGADAPLSTFQEWSDLIKTTNNRQAALVRMFKHLYPTHDPPSYGYIGKVANKVGGAGRLADLMWQHSTRPPTGSVLAYLQKVAKGQKNGKAKRDHSDYPEAPIITEWTDIEPEPAVPVPK